MEFRRASISFVLALIASPSLAFDTDRDVVRSFIDNMVAEHDYDRGTLVAALSAAESQQPILESIARPAEKRLTWPEYRNIFVRDDKIAAGVAFWQEHAGTIAAVSEATGVSEEMLVGIVGVETNFGQRTGGYRVIDALATLAFDYPPRSKFFTSELAEYLLLVREEDMDPLTATGSYAGAMGRPQFMPGSYRAYAVDFDEDGRRDIWENWHDVLGSVANYFVAHRWRSGDEVAARATLTDRFEGKTPDNGLSADRTVDELRADGVEFDTAMPGDHPAALVTLDLGEGRTEHWVGFHNFFVITRYNRNVMYAMAVEQMGEAIASAYRESGQAAGDVRQ